VLKLLNKQVLLSLLFAWQIGSIENAVAQPISSCPGLTVSGQALPLIPGPIKRVTDPETEDNVPVPAELQIVPKSIVGFFEAGGRDPYANVSTLDDISIGFLQWNHGQGSLYTKFFANVSDETIALAPMLIRNDLETFKQRSRGRVSASKALSVVRSWKKASSSDRLVRGVRSSIRSALEKWLVLDEVRQVQDELVANRMQLAYAYTRKWLRDQSIVNPDSRTVDVTLTSFFDILVYNGGRKKMWLPHVEHFREQFENDLEMFEYIRDWLAKCKSVFHPEYAHKKMYNAKEAYENGKFWASAFEKNPTQFNENQIRLFVFGYLVATRSVGSNSGYGFRGIYQADVMMRRGAVAMTQGTVRGKDIGQIWP